jgi:O-succinylbenzoate synthase
VKIEAITLREIRMPLLHPFETSFGVTQERRIVLVELQSDGVTGWGECTAGEHPFFNEESTESAWYALREELGPLLLGQDVAHGGEGAQRMKLVRGNRMAKAALESAVWDAAAQLQGASLAALIGGTRETIACGVSLGIQPEIGQLLGNIERELEAGYQRIKVKCKPGWDLDVFAAIRERWPNITLSCDANSAYRLRDIDRLKEFDQFELLMIEQPLWADDFYFHASLQQSLQTPICLDESIRNRRDALAAIENQSCRILNIKLGRVGGFTEAIAVHNAAEERGIPVWCGGMLESGIGRSHNIALSSLENFSLPGDVSASARYWAEDIVDPPITVSPQGEIVVPTAPGRGYEVKTALVEKLTVRKEELKRS